MKFLSVRDLRGKSAEVWRELPREREMVITSNGRPVAVLTAVDEANLEESLAAWRQVRASQAVAGLQRHSVEAGNDRISTEAVDAEIRKARQSRRRRSR